MRSTVLHTVHTENKDAERFQAKLHNAQVRRAGRTRSMARRLSNSRKIPARNQYHSNVVHTTHARELSTTLAEEPTTRINRLLEAVPQRLHRELQVHLQTTVITRGAESLKTRIQRIPASIHPAMDHTQKLSRGHIRQKNN